MASDPWPDQKRTEAPAVPAVKRPQTLGEALEQHIKAKANPIHWWYRRQKDGE